MSAPMRPASPARPSSASLATTSTASASPPTTRSTVSPPAPTGTGAPASSSSLSSPLPPPAAAPAAAAAPSSTATRPPAGLPGLPASHPTPSQTAQARDALVASLGNALDTELQSRAALLHGNARALAAQERDVRGALEELRREDDKLLKVLGEGSRRVKELGDVQNWAERLERDFLVVEETVRLVREAAGSEGSWSGSGSESGSWSGSESGSERGSVIGDEDGDVRMSDGGGNEGDGRKDPSVASLGKGKGKQKLVDLPSTDAVDVDPPLSSPLRSDTAQDSGSSSVVTAIKGSEQDGSAGASPVPQASSWFKRFIWRS
ncbi:unnamed protein product [Discula destructiva]